MKNKKALLTLFVFVALAQLYVPAQMIISREKILNEGKSFKFRTQPIDPADPFRGKYIILNFSNNRINVDKEENWKRNEKVFVILENNREGYAEIKSLVRERPDFTTNYIEAKIDYVRTTDRMETAIIEYPFDRFYMEESKAYPAELEYRKAAADSLSTCYALVSVQDGEAVLKDVFINDIPIAEVVKDRLKEN